MKVLITGATGFIGGHLAKVLAEDGHEVRALARETSDTSALERLDVEIINGDLRDAAAVERASDSCELVYHLAGKTTKDQLSRKQCFAHNVEGTKNIAEAALRSGVRRLVYASSVGIYGTVCHSTIDENTAPKPNSPYRESKSIGERLVLRLHREKRLPVVAARVGSVYGPGSLSWLDVCRKLVASNFRIIGTGANSDQMIYVDDLVDGLRRCGEIQGIEGKAYILAGSEPATLREVLTIAAEELGVDPPGSSLPAMPFQTYRRLSSITYRSLKVQLPRGHYYDLFFSSHAYDTSKAQKELGHFPKVPLREGFRQLVEWYCDSGYLPSLKKVRC